MVGRRENVVMRIARQARHGSQEQKREEPFSQQKQKQEQKQGEEGSETLQIAGQASRLGWGKK